MTRAIGSALMWLGVLLLDAGDVIYWQGKHMRRDRKKDDT